MGEGKIIMKKFLGLTMLFLVLVTYGYAIDITMDYYHPTLNAISTKIVSITPEVFVSSDQAKLYLKFNDYNSSAVFARIDATDLLVNGLNGQPGTSYSGINESLLSAAISPAATKVPVLDGTKFAVGDAVAIFDTFTTGASGQEYRLLSAITTNDIYISTAITNAHSAGAIVQRLRPKASSLDVNNGWGIRAYYQHPTTPTTVSVATTVVTGKKLLVGVTANTQVQAKYYDIYVNESDISGYIEPNLVPTLANQVWVTATPLNASTTGWQVTCPVATTAYYVYVRVKDKSSNIDINVSPWKKSASAYLSSPP